MKQQTIVGGRSQIILENYLRRRALICLEYKHLPEDINENLTSLAQMLKSPSRSSFKYAVYGLRYNFRHIGLNALDSCQPLPIHFAISLEMLQLYSCSLDVKNEY